MLSRKKKTSLKAPVAVTPIPDSQSSTVSRPSSASSSNTNHQQHQSQSFTLGSISKTSSSRSSSTSGAKANGNGLVIGALSNGISNGTTRHQVKIKPVDPLGSTAGLISSLGNVVGHNNQNDIQKERELRKLIHALNNWDAIEDQTLCTLISELKRHAEHLDEKLNPLLQKLWSGNWPLRSKKVITTMESLLSELLVAHPSFVGTAIHSLVSKFLPPLTAKQLEQPDSLSLNEEKLFSIANKNLERIFSSFPMRQETAVKTIESLFPYMGKGPHVHYCYVRNLLRVMEYMENGNGKGQLLRVIIHKLIRIDVNISKAAIETQANNSISVKSEEGGQEIFPMDDLGTATPLIETMDICLNQMFEYFSQIFNKTDEQAEDVEDQESGSQSNIQSTFNYLISIFEQEILPTFGMNSVPLLYMFVLHHQPSFITNFLDFLWKKANNPNTSTVIRIQTMCYLSGMLARSKSISIKTVKRWLTRFAEWANAYVDQKVKSCHWSTVNPEAHGGFYAVCQAIFFVFSFRNKELIASRKCLSYTRTLNLGRLVTSDLNPLKACSRRIAVLFVEAAHHHQISYCRTVLERNQEATIPTIASGTLSNISSKPELFALSQLECFLPFEETQLMRSKSWINSILREYEPYYAELKVEKFEKISNPTDPTFDDEDSIEMELGSYNDKKTNHRRRSNGSLTPSLNNFYCNGKTPYKFKSEIKAEEENEMEIDGLMD